MLARDRLGVRPLYRLRARRLALFRQRGQGASSPATARIPRPFDPVGLGADVHLLASVPPQTVFRGDHRARARTPARSSTPDVDDRCRVLVPAYPATRRQAGSRIARRGGDETCAALANATSLRMLRADVPVGSYLSGGLDSSLVAALGAARDRGSGSTPSRCASRTPSTTRREFQRAMAERLGSQHHELVVTARDIARAFPDGRHPRRAAAPAHGPGAALLCSRGWCANAGIKVVLTGRGRRRDVRRLRPVPRGQGAALLGASSRVGAAAALLERLYPYLAPIARGAADDGPRVLRPRPGALGEPGFAHRPRWRSTSALYRLFCAASCARRRAGERGTSDCSSRVRRTSLDGRPCRRTSTWRFARCCPAICCRHRATAC